MNLSNTDLENLEHKAIDAIVDFLADNEDTTTFIETMMEHHGFNFSEACTETEMEAFAQLQSNLWIKLLAKTIGVL